MAPTERNLESPPGSFKTDAGNLNPLERERIEELIEASSLGTPEAVAMRRRTSPEAARRIVERSKELGRRYVVVGRIRQWRDGFRERVHGAEPVDLGVAREQAAHLREVAVRGGRTLDTYRVCELVEVADAQDDRR